MDEGQTHESAVSFLGKRFQTAANIPAWAQDETTQAGSTLPCIRPLMKSSQTWSPEHIVV